MYHHHINPVCLRAQLSDNLTVVYTGRLGTQYAEKAAPWTHSPIVGWAADGYPVYGPYGYSTANDAKSTVRRVRPSFRLRTITQRRTLPDWLLPFLPNSTQNLAANQYGPDVNAKFPLGRYVNDYEYVAGLGDLDQYNGRFTVTPEFPAGTYAYFVTVNDDGSPAFPYIMNVQYYGTMNGGNAQTVPADAADYFTNGALTQTPSTDPVLSSWYTKGTKQFARAITGFDPSAGSATTWPQNAPAGVTVNGGNRTDALADSQRIRANAANIYINSNNLPSYVIGPWFAGNDQGGVFQNWPSSTNLQIRLTRAPAVAATKTATGLGVVGLWVNGVAIFNLLDGASYSNTTSDDAGGGGVAAHANHYSAAAGERGAIAAGSLVSAYAQFNASFGTVTNTASPGATDWPTTLGATTVTVTDATGAQRPAGILYVSPTQVNYRVPANTAAGTARVNIATNGVAVGGNIFVTSSYPNVFAQTADGLANAQIVRQRGTQQIYESVATTGPAGTAAVPVVLGSDPVYLVLYGSGIGTARTTATVGGVEATVAYSGPQGTFPGLDQINILIPSSAAGKGNVSVVLTTAGKPSNPVYIVVQ